MSDEKVIKLVPKTQPPLDDRQSEACVTELIDDLKKTALEEHYQELGYVAVLPNGDVIVAWTRGRAVLLIGGTVVLQRDLVDALERRHEEVN